MNARVALAIAAIVVAVACGWSFFAARDADDASDGDRAEQRAASPENPAPLAAESTPSVAQRDAVAPASLPASSPASAPASAPVRVYGPDVLIHVKDLATRSELADVELRALPQYFWSASWSRPPEETARGAIVLAKGAVSPIVLRSWRNETDPGEQIRGFAVRGAADAGVVDADCDGAWATNRGITLWARTPLLAWERIDIDIRTDGERELLLTPGGSLRVRLENAKPAAYRALIRQAWVHVASVNPDVEAATIEITDDNAGDGERIDALPPGDYRVSASLGAWWDHDKRSTLAEAKVTLVAGKDEEVVLRLAEPPAAAREAFLGGKLTFPPFAQESQVVLCFYNVATYSQGNVDLEIPIFAMTRPAPDGRTWEFRAPAMKVGRYQVRVLPLQFDALIELPPEGNPDVNLVIGALADVTARVRDARTGLPAPIASLWWGPTWTDVGFVNHTIDVVSSTAEPGVFRFTTLPGSIELMMYEALAGTSHVFTRHAYDVVAGKNELTFEITSTTGVRFVLRDNGTALPIGPLYTGLEDGIAGPGHPTMIRIALDGVVELSAPGDYEITFPDRSPKYRPVAKRTVTVRAGEITDVVVELERP